ncbi:MAG: aminotransferase class I/II-fold pyridoxal phosphate-dependent enzyme [Anaerolineales bacterium]|nr:aminotransferase class I/II-fold pyridoxal phosphate-dependent enzyme [Anaerolineales bacterium]
MPPTAKRLASLSESVISEMNTLAKQYGAINLSSGYPDFDPPAELVAAAVSALQKGYHQYTPPWGSPRLRQALAEKQSRFMGLEIDPEIHVTITCGGTEAMLAALGAVCDPGDRVIIFSPFYETYTADSLLLGLAPLFVPLRPPQFSIDPHELRHAFQSGAKALILCNPSNPTGKVFSQDELSLIAELAQEFDVVVITDEVYEHIIFPPHKHLYLASLPGMFERTISCGSLSKTYAITGWRLGYVIAPPALSQTARKVHDYLTLAAPAPLQEAAVTALRFPDSYYRQIQEEYFQRRQLFLGFLDQAGLSYTPPQGAYFVLVDISPFGFEDDFHFCYWLVRERGIAAVPGSSFFHEPVTHLARFNFAKRLETLQQVGERLARLKSPA